MVDKRIARWVRMNRDQHGFPGDINRVPSQTITESHWYFVLEALFWRSGNRRGEDPRPAQRVAVPSTLSTVRCSGGTEMSATAVC